MAVINKDLALMSFNNTFSRLSARPLDSTSLFYTLEEAQTYAQSNPYAYVGQIISVVDESNEAASAYIIVNTAGDIEEIGTGGSSTLVVASVADLTGEDMPNDLAVGQTAFVTGESKSYILTALGDAPPSSYVWTEMTSSDTVWSGTENSVIFYALTQSAYDGISPKNADTLYFVTDSGKIFKGDTDVTSSVIATSTIPEVASAIKGKLYINNTTLEAKVTTDGTAWINLSPGYLTTGTEWAQADSNKLATIGLIKEGITATLNSLMGSGAADVIVTATASGGVQRSTMKLGADTFGSAGSTTVATEAGVTAKIAEALAWNEIVTE